MFENSMKFLSWNVNGLRSVWQKGFLDWFEREQADFVSLQETKISEEKITHQFRNVSGYQSFWHSAEKPGYSGVAIYSRREPQNVHYGIGDAEIDREGRVLTLEFKDYVLINSYFPNSGRDHERLPFKERFCVKMLEYCKNWVARGRYVILCGDYNIAHQEIDLKNPKSNQNNAGFLPTERAWMTEFLNKGFADPFRLRTLDPGHYTWWSYRPGVREKNVGWRLDYHCVNNELLDRIQAVTHQPNVKGSDHCPIALEVKFS
jgi:exodeoxyribonuclease-3